MWDGSDWKQLETNEVAKDSAYHYYEASTRYFANFAITGTKGQQSMEFSDPGRSMPVELANNGVNAPIAGNAKSTSGFEVILVLLSFIAVYFFNRRIF